MILVDRIHRLIKNARTNLSIGLLYLSWPVCVIHRYWNNKPPHKGAWFWTEVRNPKTGKLIEQDIQWYIADTGNMLSISLIILSFILIKTKSVDYTISLVTVFLISIIDILHYWLWFKQEQQVVQFQGLLMALSAYLIMRRRWKKQSNYGRPL